ncbi:MAG: hypothetical protein IPL46_30320 [Saprospiraceae bacterium]|nr:hypothetical protein [Saprospiraceae bacterium]
MNTEDLRLIEQDESKLYGYLINLAKSDQGSSHIYLFEKYLNHKSEELRSAAIYALLFVLKVDDEYYRNEAIKYIADKESDFDLRQWSISGLSQTYFGTKEIDLLKLYLAHLNDSEEDEDIKPTFLRGLLGLYGLSSRDVFLKVGTISKVEEKVMEAFASEFNEIRSLVEKEV